MVHGSIAQIRKNKDTYNTLQKNFLMMQISFKPQDFWLQLCGNYFFLAIHSEHLAESIIYNIYYLLSAITKKMAT